LLENLRVWRRWLETDIHQIVRGLSAARLRRIHSLVTERQLIFDLPAGGIGVLNLSYLVRFAVHPGLPESVLMGDPGSADAEFTRCSQYH